jgi:hypothetical protein
VWTIANADTFIAELRDGRRDEHAVTIQRGSVVPKPAAAEPPES